MQTPFHDLDAYLGLPRLSGLRLSPDGTRLVTTIATLNGKRTQYRTALWQLDPHGTEPARRLTRSRKGESSAVFTDAGDVLFTSTRPDPDADEDEDGPAALWLLPAQGGDARLIGNRLGGFGKTLSHSDVVVTAAQRLPGAVDEASEEKLRKERKERSVAAVLHTSYPVRHWDHDLGPGAVHLLTAALPGSGGTDADGVRLELTDRTPQALPNRLQDFDLAPDAGFAVVVEARITTAGDRRTVLCRLDLATGESVTLYDDPAAEAEGPLISPDGTMVLFTRATISTPQSPPHVELHLLDLSDGSTRRIAADWDRWHAGQAWLPDSSGLVLTADDHGRSPVYLLDLGHDSVRRVTGDDAAFTDPQVSPDGRWVYALRTSYAAPSEVVRIDLDAFRGSGEPVAADLLPNPVPAPELPGTLTEVSTTASDGSEVRGWLALPEGTGAADPAPLLLWIHGGPLSSWNAWSWRWCPWLMVAQGYAVLLPDPALSTGYGEAFIARGWSRWGAEPFTDLMAITDAVVARDDIDESRTAAMGGSFGGYMANWVAGQTDRFKAIVTHASLWALDQFGPTTDHAYYWAREVSDAMVRDYSPHAFVDDIATPMLVVHGDKDYRVPIGEGLRLWWELLSRSTLALDADGRTPHRFLYFPDENHWVLTPQHAAIWYGTVSAFLAEHVLGEPKEYPDLLG
ncbi:S9 family peptidase [Micropruina sonneratiae]|uniref:S9 family peptidase n=1 Tax=Micropruina sonneratiae TaxID=2986940 RepID=UPI0022276EF2|nr:alpha/beta fold hydrolase [Micropruina sp. KQZ13P-5]MCW3158266.1 prolyl oligopeptidase family serine peptidase [Micropruina sp. KQZ13P-5]